MLLDAFSRFFLQFDLVVKPYRNNGLPLPFMGDGKTLDIEDILTQRVAAGKAKIVIRKDDVAQITKIDVRPQDKIAVLLFRRSDPAAATPVFEHRKTGALRRAHKDVDEAVSVSSHMIVHLDPQPGAHNRYRTIIEEVPGLGRTYMEAILAEALRNAKYSYKDHRGDEKETYSLIDFQGVKSEGLSNALKKGSLSFIELVRPATIQGLDTEGVLAPKEERLRIAVKAQAEGLKLIERVRAWAKANNWDDVRVRINMSDDRSRVVTIAREEEAADILFVRAEQVRVTRPLDPCTDKINEELVKKALEVLKK